MRWVAYQQTFEDEDAFYVLLIHYTDTKETIGQSRGPRSNVFLLLSEECQTLVVVIIIHLFDPHGDTVVRNTDGCNFESLVKTFGKPINFTLPTQMAVVAENKEDILDDFESKFIELALETS